MMAHRPVVALDITTMASEPAFRDKLGR